MPYVGGDYFTATAELARRARARGHARFAYIGPSGGPESSLDRWRGFTSALDGAEPVLHLPGVGGSPPAVFDTIRSSRATAAFFTELADAIGVETTARAHGLSVPGDLSIVVLGSHLRAAQSGTNFTSFEIPREEMARQATAMLAERIETGSRGSQVLLACEPVEGETLGTISNRTMA